MVTRTTTGGVLRNYKYNLQRSFNTLTASRNTVMSQRTFENFAEDPATATQCFQLRRAMLRTNTQYNVGGNVGREYDIAYQALDSIISRVDNDIDYYNTDNNALLRALNDPVGGGRLALGQTMKEMAEGMVQTMNSAKYGDIFVFGGSDGLNIPFTWNTDPDTGELNLFYRNAALDSAYLSRPSSTAVTKTVASDTAQTPQVPAQYELDLDGLRIDGSGTTTFTIGGTPYKLNIASDDNVLKVAKKLETAINGDQTNGLGATFEARATDGGTKIVLTERAAGAVAADQDLAPGTTYDVKFDLKGGAADKLKYYSTEGVYVDIGIGLAEDGSGKLIPSSAFNSALPGINFLGWGVDQDGDPNNIISLSWKMGEILSRCNPDDGNWASEQDGIDFERLAGKFGDAAQRLKEQHTVLTTRKAFLNTNQKQLSDSYASMNEQLDAIERVDLADAISSFSWAQYCYNAALKVGNSVLSQSLMDYLN